MQIIGGELTKIQIILAKHVITLQMLLAMLLIQHTFQLLEETVQAHLVRVVLIMQEIQHQDTTASLQILIHHGLDGDAADYSQELGTQRHVANVEGAHPHVAKDVSKIITQETVQAITHHVMLITLITPHSHLIPPIFLHTMLQHHIAVTAQHLIL